MTDSRELVTATEGADRLGVPVGTVYAWISTGRLNAVGRATPTGRRHAGARLFDLDHLRKLAKTTTRRTR